MAIVLGLVGEPDHAAAAIAVDGQIVAAVDERAMASSAGECRHEHQLPLRAIAACLRIADTDAAAIDRIAVIGEARSRHHVDLHRGAAPCEAETAGLRDRLRTAPRVIVGPPRALAAQMKADDDVAVLAIETEPCPSAQAFLWRDNKLKSVGAIDGVDAIASLIRRMAVAFLLPPCRAFAEVDRLSAAGEAEFACEFEEALTWQPEERHHTGRSSWHARIDVRDEIVDDLLVTAGESRHANVAASFRARLATLIAEIARDLREYLHVECVAFSGGWCASPRMNTVMVSALGPSTSVAPVPTREGLALGAALVLSDTAMPIRTLALGPCFSESEMKLALDNCRLDYVYEPDWSRLLRRVSSMLAQGKTIGWFHGPMDFGPRSLGGRSVLADPSNRYARANVNQYLKGRPQPHPLPVSMADSVAAECLDAPAASPFMQFRSTVHEARRHQVRAALEGSDQIWYHSVSTGEQPALSNLLETHHRATGVPGLINVNLSGRGEPTACTPRDAIRTMFSSAVDALVMGRFLVMKDYWLLRTDEADA